MVFFLIAANIVMVGSFVLKYGSIPEQIPMFYSKPWGEDQLGESWMIFLIPVLLIMFVLVNVYIKKKFTSDNEFIGKILEYVNITLIISFTAIFLKILFSVS